MICVTKFGENILKMVKTSIYVLVVNSIGGGGGAESGGEGGGGGHETSF